MRVGVKTESAASLYVQNMQVFGHGGVLMGEGGGKLKPTLYSCTR